MTPEQQARDLLERLSDCTHYNDPQSLSAGDVVELANIITDRERLSAENSKLNAQLHSIRKLAGDWVQGVGPEKVGVVMNAIWQHADGRAEPTASTERDDD